MAAKPQTGGGLFSHLLPLLALLPWLACSPPSSHQAAVFPSLEDRTPDGGFYTPGTQSFLRGSHWLEGITAIDIRQHASAKATVTFLGAEEAYHLKLVNLPLALLVPRLHYIPEAAPDAFDALNLRLAEYARNSLSVPVGKPGDNMAHFETNLPEAVPWRLNGDFDFQPNPYTRPVRVGMVNNCLDPGLWELSASDRSGEIYHAWFTLPRDVYEPLIAAVNQLPREFVTASLSWSEASAPLGLDRLRDLVRQVDEVPFAIHREPMSTGFSSQDSRRKLARGFAQVQDLENGDWRVPYSADEVTVGRARLTEFAPPGKYVLGGYKEFDLTFLRGVRSARVNLVKPKTRYDMAASRATEENAFEYIELVLFLHGYRIVLGNLPLQLMSPREDFAINGFGVGVLSSSGFAERRDFLVQQGPAPSYAYLVKEDAEGPQALNSHSFGLEQVFIRTHLDGEGAWWECTLTSYERIVDIIKYRVPVPDEMVAIVRQHALEYISPIYFTYRDDNLR